MRKWNFWLIMCLVSILNGILFYQGSMHAMQQGIQSVDNQAALLFTPILWIIAVVVLIILNLYTFAYGRRIKSDCIIHPTDVFHFKRLKKNEIIDRVLFFIITCLLMFFGFSLFSTEYILSIGYALSGGVLLIDLYIWQKAGFKKTII